MAIYNRALAYSAIHEDEKSVEDLTAVLEMPKECSLSVPERKLVSFFSDVVDVKHETHLYPRTLWTN